MSESLSSLFKKCNSEPIGIAIVDSLVKRIALKKIRIFRLFFPAFPLFMPKSKSLLSLFFEEQPEQFTLVALYTRGTVSKFLPLLATKARPRERFASFALLQERITISLFHSQKQAIRWKNKRAKSQP